MAVRGDIFHHKSLVFHNGHIGKKYLILLNTPSKNESYVFVKTTSQRKDKPTTPGCIKTRSLFFIPLGTTWFQKPTWIQLYEIYPFLPVDVRNKSEIKLVGTLAPRLIEEIIDCLFLTQEHDLPISYRQLLRPPMQESMQKLLDRFGRKH